MNPPHRTKSENLGLSVVLDGTVPLHGDLPFSPSDLIPMADSSFPINRNSSVVRNVVLSHVVYELGVVFPILNTLRTSIIARICIAEFLALLILLNDRHQRHLTCNQILNGCKLDLEVGALQPGQVILHIQVNLVCGSDDFDLSIEATTQESFNFSQPALSHFEVEVRIKGNRRFERGSILQLTY